jgi:serine/threonine-protein kinase HipA
MTDARVILWGRDIGAVSWLEERGVAVFQYTPEFVASGIEVAPIMMPLADTPYQFAALSKESFSGLPGLLADSLPDKFGNALIDAWLAGRGRTAESFNPVERLCYIGERGMGALEYAPAVPQAELTSTRLDVAQLVSLANQILDERASLHGSLTGDHDAKALEEIIRVGTSAGGARAKAILAWNKETGEFRSGQVKQAQGFAPWLLKFDGISNNRDKELADPQGYGLLEYAYHLMAKEAGIEMTECRLHRESGRAHFMTRRFDRTSDGKKIHMQSLAAMMHFDFNRPDAYSYEQAMQTLLRLQTSMTDIEQQFLRAVFNALARNQDDHVKNIAYLMDKKGVWRLAPAFDIAYAYNPQGDWTNQHQMSINGKRRAFNTEDFLELARAGGIKPRRASSLIAQCAASIKNWPKVAAQAGVCETDIQRVGVTHRIL